MRMPSYELPKNRLYKLGGENGLLVPIRDSNALANALRILIENPPLRSKMGARGREIAVAEFSDKHVIEQTLAVYTKLLLRVS